VPLAAPALLEVAYGWERLRRVRQEFGDLLTWFSTLVSGPTFEIVPLARGAAVLAGRLRATTGEPPPRRGERRSRSERRISWLLDVQIAATAWAAGFDVATANTNDFELIAEQLNELAPTAPPLEVVGPPF
jgi:predicted nucleic acid-binding protein